MQPPEHDTLAEQLPSSALHEQSSKIPAVGEEVRSKLSRREAAKNLIVLPFGEAKFFGSVGRRVQRSASLLSGRRSVGTLLPLSGRTSKV